MTNYDTIVYYICKNYPRQSLILDYGCGDCSLVRTLCSLGYDARGCEMFYRGGIGVTASINDLLRTGRVQKMENGVIPFPSRLFDVVVHNQVIEHVKDIDLAWSEMARITKRDGQMLGLFPDKSVWREGHAGVPFVHRITKSPCRTLVLFTARLLGLGLWTERKTRWRWARDMDKWLRRWTHYRSWEELERSARVAGWELTGIEDEWCYYRKPLTHFFPSLLRTWAVKKWMGHVVIGRLTPTYLEQLCNLPSPFQLS